jgi:hypothetical protein
MHGKNSFKLAFGASEMKTTVTVTVHTYSCDNLDHMAIKITIKGKCLATEPS